MWVYDSILFRLEIFRGRFFNVDELSESPHMRARFCWEARSSASKKWQIFKAADNEKQCCTKMCASPLIALDCIRIYLRKAQLRIVCWELATSEKLQHRMNGAFSWKGSRSEKYGKSVCTLWKERITINENILNNGRFKGRPKSWSTEHVALPQ